MFIAFAVMTADDDQSSMSKALCKGAKLYFIKPILISDLRGLWQFAMWKRKDRTVASEDVSEGIIVNKDQGCQSFKNKGNTSLQSAKGKEQELVDKDKEGEKNESFVQKRKRITWTDGLHTKFLEAVKLAGVDGKIELKFFVCLFLAIATRYALIALYSNDNGCCLSYEQLLRKEYTSI